MPTSASRETLLKVWKDKAQAGKEGCFSRAGIVPGDVCGGGTEPKPQSDSGTATFVNPNTGYLGFCPEPSVQ